MSGLLYFAGTEYFVAAIVRTGFSREDLGIIYPITMLTSALNGALATIRITLATWLGVATVAHVETYVIWKPRTNRDDAEAAPEVVEMARNNMQESYARTIESPSNQEQNTYQNNNDSGSNVIAEHHLAVEINYADANDNNESHVITDQPIGSDCIVPQFGSLDLNQNIQKRSAKEKIMSYFMWVVYYFCCIRGPTFNQPATRKYNSFTRSVGEADASCCCVITNCSKSDVINSTIVSDNDEPDDVINSRTVSDNDEPDRPITDDVIIDERAFKICDHNMHGPVQGVESTIESSHM